MLIHNFVQLEFSWILSWNFFFSSFSVHHFFFLHSWLIFIYILIRFFSFFPPTHYYNGNLYVCMLMKVIMIVTIMFMMILMMIMNCYRKRLYLIHWKRYKTLFNCGIEDFTFYQIVWKNGDNHWTKVFFFLLLFLLSSHEWSSEFID